MELKRLIYLLLPFLFGFCFESKAFLFKEISTKDGLSNRRVFATTKDHKGYIWFATRSGIDRYNGEKFDFYELPQHNESFLEKPKGIITDNDGKVYAFSEKNIYYYDQNIDGFKLFKPLIISNSEYLNTIFFSCDNKLWIGTSQGLHYRNENDSLVNCRLPKGTSVFCITSLDSQSLWVGTSRGLFKISKTASNQYISMQQEDLHNIRQERIQSLYYDKLSKKLWIGTFSDGLKLFDTEKSLLKDITEIPVNFPIRSITHINNTRLWVGINGAGIYELDRFNGKIEQIYSQSEMGVNLIKANGIYDILNDQNFIWICTYTSGVLLFNKGEIIHKMYRHFMNHNSLEDDYVNVMMEDSDNNLWFGTNKGLSKLNVKTQKWDHYSPKDASKHAVVLSLCEDKERNIWVGGFASDILRINLDNNKIETIKIPTNNKYNLAKNYIYSIVKDHNNDIWLGGIIEELTQYIYKTGEFRHYKLKGINKIIDYNKDSLLIATNRGLVFFNKNKEKVQYIDIAEMTGNKSKHLFPFVNSICVEPNNPQIIWFGTESDGLYKLDLSSNQLSSFTMKDGLSSNNIFGIQPDKLGRLWISTENGLNCFNPQNANIDIFYEIDGLPANSFNFLAYTTLNNGNMLWGTPLGAVEIIPEKFIKKQKKPFNLHFEKFTLFYTEITAGQLNSPLQVSIDKTEKLTLKHNQHSFTFDFINLNYFDNSKILYSWKLEGFDSQWSNPSNDHKAVYTNIPPGKYTFLVKAARADNEKIFVTRELEMHIQPPFWATPFAIICYIILILVIIYFMIRIYKNRLDAKDSEQKIRFFVNIAHDIRTPLTLIKAPLHEIEAEKLSSNGVLALQLARKNTEKLLNMVSQLLDFQKIEREAMRLYIEKTEINSYIENCVNNFQLLAKEKQLNLNIKLLDTTTTGWIDRHKLSLIIDNMLSNSIKYTHPQGNISVKLSLLNKYLILDIIDDGIGISTQAQKKLFNRFYRGDNAANSKETGSGIGLLLTKKMVVLHKGKISFSSIEGVGTSFRIEIPINKESYKTSELIKKEDSKEKDESITRINQNNEDPNRIKVLLVEDNEELRNYLARYLNKHYCIEEANDGEEALKLIKRINPDFIISDVLMPKLSGIGLCQNLKSNIETCHIPVILLTSLAEREDIIKGLNAGADDYITKPFDLSVLESKINAILKNRALYRKKYIDKSAFSDNSSIANELDKKFMNQVIDFIEEKMMIEDFTIDTLALDMAMSRSVFYKKIKSLTGQNPKDLIKELKMKKAVSLLREQKYSISEISYLTGFPNSKYFSTAFKKYYGTTPSSFLEKELQDIN